MKDLKDVIGMPGTPLATVLAKAERIRQIEACILPIIEEALRPHCRVSQVEAGILLLLVDSAAWATRLRFWVPTLLEKLQIQPNFSDLRAITVKVGVLPEAPKLAEIAPHQRAIPLSEGSKKCLQDLSESVEDEKLSQVLKRLAE